MIHFVKKAGLLSILFLFVHCYASEPRILLIEPWPWIKAGGLGINNVNQARLFNEHGYYFITLFWQGLYSEALFNHEQLPYEVFSHDLHMQLSYPYEEFLTRLQSGWVALPDEVFQHEITKVCAKHSINIVITPRWEDVILLKKIANKIGIKIIFVRHASIEQDFIKSKYSVSAIREIDGFVGGNTEIAQHVQQENSTKKLNIKNCVAITPFWDQDKCLQFKTNETSNEYFAREYGINVGYNEYVIATVANLDDPCKNHALLLKAVAQILSKKYTVHLMIAGSGSLKSQLEIQAYELNIQKYVHFLGSVQNIPELLYHSHMHVLPSYHESFSLANLEAACMKKPIIMARGLSASRLVHDRETGLLFNNHDAQDLAKKIIFLIDHEDEGCMMGENLYWYVKETYCNEIIFKQWERLIDRVFKQAYD